MTNHRRDMLEDKILNMGTDWSPNENQALLTLLEQLHEFSNAEISRDAITTEIKQKRDVLTGFYQDSGFFENVRNIQDEMINFFGCE
jgi:hypothetical protein